jgi:hypothetical protein
MVCRTAPTPRFATSGGTPGFKSDAVDELVEGERFRVLLTLDQEWSELIRHPIGEVGRFSAGDALCQGAQGGLGQCCGLILGNLSVFGDLVDESQLCHSDLPLPAWLPGCHRVAKPDRVTAADTGVVVRRPGTAARLVWLVLAWVGGADQGISPWREAAACRSVCLLIGGMLGGSWPVAFGGTRVTWA